EVTGTVSARAGTPVDVADFVDTLVQCELVADLDGVPLRAEAADQGPRWWTALRPERVRPLFSRPAWVVYAGTLVFVVAVFAGMPQYRPSFEDWIFYPDPALCLAVVAVTGILLAGCHEFFHWLAARAAGVAGRFSVGRRAFIVVFETDLSQLWGLPRRRRFGPLLAGLAFDVLVTAGCLAGRIAGPPPLLDRVLAMVVLVQVVAVFYQCLAFLRTDLYFVLLTALGCRDLNRVTRLYLRSRLFTLTPEQAAALDGAHPRDRRVAPWFALGYLAGIALLTYLFVNYWLPATAMMGGWVALSLVNESPVHGAFWEALGLTLVLLLPVVSVVLVWLRQRRTARVEA
ncbi:MAG TPA: hypothetical protein VKB69_13140, partial [Micromonosporaceae bacterium]|nr:hypothetical protein [Micromonosporaceae bacterium]